MTLYFINPQGRAGGRSMATKKHGRRKLTGAAKKAFLARMKRGRRKAAGKNPVRVHLGTIEASRTKSKTNPRRKRRKTSGVRTVAKRRKSSHRRKSTRRNPPAAARRRSRRRTRRNPPFSGIIGKAVRGVKNAAFVTAGKMGTNLVSRLVPVTSPMLGIAVRAAAALGVGIAAEMVIGRDAAEYVLAGGLTAPIESAIKAVNVPLLTGALSSDEALRNYARMIGSYPQRLNAYPQNVKAAGRGGVAAYPQGGRLSTRRSFGDSGGQGLAYSRNGGASMM